MDFFDELGRKASRTYRYATEKTGKISKVAKLKMLMSQDKGQIQELYEEIGEKVYEKHIREEDFDITEFVEERCSDIDLLCDEIESARMEILELRDRKQCENCYCEIDLDYSYCPNCGKSQKEEKIVEDKKQEKYNDEDKEESIKQELAHLPEVEEKKQEEIENKI